MTYNMFLSILFSAKCDRECLNGGVCINPDECRCPEQFTGDYCEIGEITSGYLPFVIKKNCFIYRGVKEMLIKTFILDNHDQHFSPNFTLIHLKMKFHVCYKSACTGKVFHFFLLKFPTK